MVWTVTSDMTYTLTFVTLWVLLFLVALCMGLRVFGRGTTLGAVEVIVIYTRTNQLLYFDPYSKVVSLLLGLVSTHLDMFNRAEENYIRRSQVSTPLKIQQ